MWFNSHTQRLCICVFACSVCEVVYGTVRQSILSIFYPIYVCSLRKTCFTKINKRTSTNRCLPKDCLFGGFPILIPCTWRVHGMSVELSNTIMRIPWFSYDAHDLLQNWVMRKMGRDADVDVYWYRIIYRSFERISISEPVVKLKPGVLVWLGMAWRFCNCSSMSTMTIRTVCITLGSRLGYVIGLSHGRASWQERWRNGRGVYSESSWYESVG
jgi:hypothetical protein